MYTHKILDEKQLLQKFKHYINLLSTLIYFNFHNKEIPCQNNNRLTFHTIICLKVFGNQLLSIRKINDFPRSNAALLRFEFKNEEEFFFLEQQKSNNLFLKGKKELTYNICHQKSVILLLMQNFLTFYELTNFNIFV